MKRSSTIKMISVFRKLQKVQTVSLINMWDQNQNRVCHQTLNSSARDEVLSSDRFDAHRRRHRERLEQFSQVSVIYTLNTGRAHTLLTLLAQEQHEAFVLLKV